MKKYFYLLMACCLPAITLVSCGDDDDEPTSSYVRGIYEMDGKTVQGNLDPSPFYTWLASQVEELNKVYGDTKAVNMKSDELACAKFDDADKALKDLKDQFDNKLATCDFGPNSFSVQYQYRVIKSANPEAVVIKKTDAYDFTYKYEGNTRRITEKQELMASKVLEFSRTYDGYIKIGLETIFDNDMTYELLSEDVKAVKGDTYEYNNDNLFGNPQIETFDGSEEYSHVLSVQFELTQDKKDALLGEWYLLVPVKVSNSRGESMSFDVQIPVSIL